MLTDKKRLKYDAIKNGGAPFLIKKHIVDAYLYNSNKQTKNREKKQIQFILCFLYILLFFAFCSYSSNFVTKIPVTNKKHAHERKNTKKTTNLTIKKLITIKQRKKREINEDEEQLYLPR